MTLSIIISALGQNLYKIEDWVSTEILNSINEIIIVVQKLDTFEREAERLKDIGCRLIIDNNIGLSRSRNIGIKHCNSDFFWILDDDVYTDHIMIKHIINAIQNKDSDIYTFRIAKNKNKALHKKYFNKKNITRLHSLKVSSIEIVVSKEMISKFSISFNEEFGLGSKYPSCEENLFLLNCIDFGAKITHIPEVVVIHSDITSGYDNSTNQPLIAKGYICQKFGIFGIVLFFYWYFKFILIYKNIFILKYLIKGYFLKID